MFATYTVANSLFSTGYAIAALILWLVDRPMAASAMIICAELSAVCAAIYRTADK